MEITFRRQSVDVEKRVDNNSSTTGNTTTEVAEPQGYDIVKATQVTKLNIPPRID